MKTTSEITLKIKTPNEQFNVMLTEIRNGLRADVLTVCPELYDRYGLDGWTFEMVSCKEKA